MAEKQKKVNDIAKEFNIKSNVITDLLKEYDDTQRKAQTALNADELDFIFERFTTEHSVTDMNSFFARKKPEAVKPAEEKKAEEKKPEEKKSEEKKPEEKKSEEKKPEEKKPEEKKTEEKKPEEKKPAEKRPAAEHSDSQTAPKADRNVRPADSRQDRYNRPGDSRQDRYDRSADGRQDRNNNRPGDARQDRNNNRPGDGRQDRNSSRFGDTRQDRNNSRFGDTRQDRNNSRPGDARQDRNNNRPADDRTDRNAKTDRPARPEVKPAVQPSSQNGQPFKKKEKKADDAVQSRTKGERKTVNTRSEEVELEKYNEKYEQLTSDSVNERDTDNRKQKIKQKSQQYNKKQGTRSHKKETEQERLARIQEERSKRHLVIRIGDEITVGELASELKITANEVIKKLFAYGVMASINETIDYDTAEIVATELGAKVEKLVEVSIEDRIIDTTEDEDDNLEPRSPVVVVMGHVDHGKTSILDAIRHTSVTSTESGGITQHIGAYSVSLDGNDITFLDTPGHAAFTEMRARGAKATDIAVLVVAADDGIMPQTIEAINHAKAADVAVIVAINKMDKPAANPDRVMQQLTEYGLIAEDWGGDTICVPVSAKTGQGIDKLLESILLVAEMRELRANPNRAAKGVVIEARLDKGKGPIATLLVQNGTLRGGDIVVAGTAVGKVRVMTDYRGRRVKEAGPSVPVEVMGLAEVPKAGDMFDAVSDEKLARELVEQRKQKIKDDQFNATKKVTLDSLFSTLEEGELKDLNIIVKADVQGSVEALRQNLEKLSNDEVRVNVIHGGVGAIVESDVMLANVSNAIIVGFHVRPDATAQANAERDHVEMRMYSVIYDCIEDVQAAIKGMLAPKYRDVELGKAEIRMVYRLSSAGTIAGSYIQSGKVTRNCKIRVVRDGIVVAEDSIASLKRMKDDAKEVMAGYECGIGLEKFNDIKEGDILEAFVVEEYRE